MAGLRPGLEDLRFESPAGSLKIRNLGVFLSPLGKLDLEKMDIVIEA